MIGRLSAPRLAASALRVGVIVAAVILLLAGCRPASVGEDGADGSPGVDGAGDSHVVHGEDGGGGVHGRDGADGADGVDGADGIGADGADGRSGIGYSDGDSVSGSGRLTSRHLTFSDVTSLLVGANFVVHVTIGEPEQATVRMDDNLTELVDATVTGDQLRLGLKPGASVRNATLSAKVTVRHLDRLTSTGAGEVTLASELAGEQLEIETGGASQVTGTVHVAQVQAVTSGAGMLALSGHVGHLDLSGSGTSALRLADLTVRDLDAVLSGVSCASVTVRDTLAARAGGASTLRYSGTPRITRQETSGVSSITADQRPGDRCDSSP